LMPRSQLEESNSKDSVSNGSSRSFWLKQRHNKYQSDDERYYPPPPRSYPQPWIDREKEEAIVKVPLRRDIFGDDHGALLKQCLSCGWENEGRVGSVPVCDVPSLHLPRQLTRQALQYHIMTHCNLLSSATTGTSLQYSFYTCAAYVHLFYNHPFMQFDAFLSVGINSQGRADNSNQPVNNVTDVFTSWQEGGVSRPLDGFDTFDSDLCNDPLWCSKTSVFRREITKWQNPESSDYYNCQDAKFLIYVVPNKPEQSLVDLVRELGFMLRFAMCHDRILVLSFQLFGQSPVSIVGLFGSLTSCPITPEAIMSAVPAKNGLNVGLYPCKRSKYVYMIDIPTTGDCSSFHMHWTGSFEVLYGYQLGLAGHIMHTANGVVTDNTVNDVYDHSKDRISGVGSLFSSRRMEWLAQMVRYVVQPHPVLSAAITGVVQKHMYSSPPLGFSEFMQGRNTHIPRPFATLFLTAEAVVDGGSSNMSKGVDFDAHRCLRVLQRRAPFIKHVFIPADSLTVLPLIRSVFKEFELHYLLFNNIDSEVPSILEPRLMQLADVSVAVEADFFLGHLRRAPTADLVNMLQRTRGDGGSDFYSVDAGSSWEGF